MSTRMISIDPSTKASGVATFDDGKLIDFDLFKCNDTDVESRIHKMGAALLDYLKKQKPDMIYIEHPQGHGKNVALVGMICELLGIVRAYAIARKIEYKELSPTVWRKYCGFNQGKKTRQELKQMSIDYVKEHFDITVSDDVADAVSLGTGVINYFQAL